MAENHKLYPTLADRWKTKNPIGNNDLQIKFWTLPFITCDDQMRRVDTQRTAIKQNVGNFAFVWMQFVMFVDRSNVQFSARKHQIASAWLIIDGWMVELWKVWLKFKNKLFKKSFLRHWPGLIVTPSLLNQPVTTNWAFKCGASGQRSTAGLPGLTNSS